MGGSHQADSGSINEGNRNPLHLRRRPDTRDNLHAGRNHVSAGSEHGGHIQPGPRKTECGNLCLRDQGLQHSVELRAGSRFGKRPALVAHVGELWRRLLCERRDGQGNCRRLPGERPEPYREIQRGGLHETLHGLRSTRFRKGPYAFIHLTERHARKTFRPIPCRRT